MNSDVRFKTISTTSGEAMSIHTAFLRLYWDKGLDSLYSDQLLKSQRSNSLLININKAFAYIQVNIINHIFLSKNALKWRKIYLDSRVQEPGLKLDQSQDTFGKSYTLASIFINSPRHQHHKSSDQDQKFDLIRRNNSVFAVFMVVELLLCFRYLLNLSFYSTLARTEQKLTTTKLLYGLYQVRSEPISVTSLLNINQTHNETEICNSSYNHLASKLSDKYEGFLLWDKHIARVSNPFIKRWFLLENEEPLQLMGPEVKLAMRSVSVFILFCGILSGLVFVWRPIDIPHMVFIHDPRFCAFWLHYKLHVYLDSMRFSYMNYISNVRLFSEKRSQQEFKSSNSESNLMKTSIVDDLSLSYSKFCDYLPGARRQTWRKILIIYQTFMLMNINIFSFLMLFFVCYYMIGLNDMTVQLNSDLKTLLLEGRQSDILWRPTIACTGQTLSSGSLEDKLADGLIAYAYRSGTNIPWELLRSNMSGREFVASRLGPTRNVDPQQWLLVALSSVNVSLVASAYIVAFILCIVDLSVWLIELQMKLRTCAFLVEYIQSANYLHQDDISHTSGFLDSRSHSKEYMNKREESTEQVQVNEISHCSFETWDVFQYLISSRANRIRTCKTRAMRIIAFERFDTLRQRRATECFLYSTYLDVRLFENEIDLCRPIVNYSITYAVFEALILVLGTGSLSNTWVKIGILLFSFTLSNSFLLMASFFESQCSKLVNPIFSILSIGFNSDKRLQHMALLWRKYLNDITGTHSKFVFRLFSFKVTYATTIQFNLSLASLVIIIAGS